MERYLLDIDQELKEAIFSTARRHFESAEEFYRTIGISRESANSHIRGESEKLDLQAADKLSRITGKAEPRFNLDDIYNEKVLEETTWAGEERVVLDEDYQRFLFTTFDLDELEDITGASRDALINYRMARNKTTPKEIYEDVFEAARASFDLHFQIEGDIHFESPTVGKGENTVVEDAGTEDVERVARTGRMFDRLPDLEKVNFSRMRKHYEEPLDKLIERIEDGQLYIKSRNSDEGRTYSALETMGVLEEFGSKTRKINATAGEVERIKAYFENNQKTDGRKEYHDFELIKILRDEAEELGETPTRAHFREKSKEADDFPSPNTYARENHFGSWNNAVWQAGLELREHEYDDEALIDMLRGKAYRDGVPGAEDLDADPSVPSFETYRSRFDSYQNALEEAGLTTPGNLDYTEGVYSFDRYADAKRDLKFDFLEMDVPVPGKQTTASV